MTPQKLKLALGPDGSIDWSESVVNANLAIARSDLDWATRQVAETLLRAGEFRADTYISGLSEHDGDDAYEQDVGAATDAVADALDSALALSVRASYKLYGLSADAENRRIQLLWRFGQRSQPFCAQAGTLRPEGVLGFHIRAGCTCGSVRS